MRSRVMVKDIIELVEDLAPLYLAEKWDNCGLQLGDRFSLVDKVMVSLDVTEEVIDQALDKGVSLLICHHPLFFVPLKNVDLKTSTGRIIKKALEGELNIYTAHTNLDICTGGINDYLASLLGLEETKPLKITFSQTLYKLVVFVPSNYVEVVRDAICKRGGITGNYSHCTFQVKGQGTFKPLEGSQPFIGTEGKIERVEEIRLETLLNWEERDVVLEAMIEAHPYEEVAYDIYPLRKTELDLGIGRWGYLPENLSLKSLIERAQKVFGLDTIDLIGPVNDMQQTIKKVALCGGSGGDFIEEALEAGVQVYITGDLKYHQLQVALENQLLILSVHHHVTERVGLQSLADHLLQRAQEMEYTFDLMMAQETLPMMRF